MTTFLRRLIGRVAFRRVAGFSVMETMLAAVLIGGAGMTLSHLLLKGMVNVAYNKQAKKAAALADMAYERYVIYAASASALPQFNTSVKFHTPNPVTPAAFFNAPDNLGYDGMVLVSSAVPVGNLHRVTVTVSWLNGGPGHTMAFNRFFFGTNQLNNVGGHVDAFVTDFNGQPLSNVQVRALSYDHYQAPDGTNDVITYTDAGGNASLGNVMIGSHIGIFAQRPGSDATVSASNGNFLQGYYVNTGPFSVSSKMSQVKAVSATSPVFVQFMNQFRPLGRLTGRAFNDTNASDVSAQQIQLSFPGGGTTGASDGNAVRNDITWTVSTDASGNYEFANIIPGQILLTPIGRVRGPLQTLSDPLDQGTVVDPSQLPTLTAMPNPAAVQASGTNFHVLNQGTVQLHAQVLASGVPINNATVQFDVHATDPWHTASSPVFNTDINGNLTVYNAISEVGTPGSYTFTISRAAPTNCSDWGYAGTANASCQAGSACNVTGTVASGSAVHGTITSNPAHTGFMVSAKSIMGQANDGPTTGANDFMLCGLMPNVSVPVNITDPSVMVSDVFTDASVAERSTGQAIAGATISNAGGSVSLGNVCPAPPSPPVVSDAAGNFPSFCATVPFIHTEYVTPTATPTTPQEMGTITMGLASGEGKLTVTYSPYFDPDDQIIAFPHTSAPVFHIGLIGYPVVGTISDITTPLEGIPVNSWLATTTSDASGHYSIVASVSGRDSINPGTMSVWTQDFAVAANTGMTYAIAYGNAGVPPTLDMTPITIDMQPTALQSGL